MYTEKCTALLNDHEVYRECKDQPKSIFAKVLKHFLDLKSCIGPKFKDQYNKLCLPGDNSPPARFYGLSKSIKLWAQSISMWHFHLQVSQVPTRIIQ